ncbi:Lrp/AsnC ligand binding domain-containing protein, partial [Wenyingzhuangia sp. 1_MG-2023]|nr:Lrp/AsnC ligand binding domain-containing protein [Wenyingzhuangia sp. 1_MG-2023]
SQALLELTPIQQVYSVAGSYDLVAIAEAGSNEQIAQLVTANIHKLHGIQDTDTMFAFASHSQKDMESMFDMGND